MKLLRCPIHGWRPLSEFIYGGELRRMPEPATADDRQWADYVFNRRGEPGVLREWWYHVPSGTWFVAERDTLRDEVRDTWLWPPPEAVAPGGREAQAGETRSAPGNAQAPASGQPPTAGEQPPRHGQSHDSPGAASSPTKESAV